jgi:hypothetical protein
MTNELTSLGSNQSPMTDNCWLIWIIAGIGTATLIDVFWKMEGGFGPYNLRAVGITLVLTFTALIAAKYQIGIPRRPKRSLGEITFAEKFLC